MRHPGHVFVSLILFLFLSGAALAEGSPAAVAQLLTKELVGNSGKEVLMSTVTYPPGGASPPHRHDAQVFVYVLEGALIMQVQGGRSSPSRPGTRSMKAPATCTRCRPTPVKRRPRNFWCSSSRTRARPRRVPRRRRPQNAQPYLLRLHRRRYIFDADRGGCAAGCAGG